MSVSTETTYQIVKEAIRDRKTVIAKYNGHTRKMCPHVIGRKNGVKQALFYQFAGTSSTGLGRAGSPDNWRCIPIAGLRIISVEDGEWHTASNHSREQTCVDEIDLKVRISVQPS